MLAHVNSCRDGSSIERRREYKSRADDVLLSRSHKNSSQGVVKFDSPRSDDAIFDMLSAYTKK